MEKTLDAFEVRRTSALAALTQLKAFLAGGESLGVRTDASLKDKLQKAMEEAAADKLKVALVGGFSEGKTTIAAAWMEQLKCSMKISHQESSDAVTFYDTESGFVLMDTPGLFGFKEQSDAATGAIERYKDITEKRVSEAHLVLYVMGSANPIKESHREELIWLFRTLNLLPRTVFVLSRFDEVADVEDDREYEEHLAIKRKNVTGRLRELINLTDQETADLSIVGVAANPFDLGTEHWLSDLVRFRALSRIDTLQAATSRKVAANGGAMVVVHEARASIVRDVLTKQLPVAVENHQRIDEEAARLEAMSGRLQNQIGAASSQIVAARSGLRQFVLDYFSDLILQARGASLETFTHFFEREVGADGIVISTRMQDELERQLSSVNHQISRMTVDFDAEVNHFNGAMSLLGKQGMEYVLKSNLINNTSVLAARDGMVSVAKAMGVDLGSVLKFKPWGAVNLAKGINGALAFVGLALEAWDSWEQAKREEIFHKAIERMVINFEKQRQELIELIGSDEFVERFFPNYGQLQAGAQSLQQSVTEISRKREAFQKWREMGEVINADFSVIAHAN